MKQKIEHIITLPFWRKDTTLLGLWGGIGFISAMMKMHDHNNFRVFCGVFQHTIRQSPLFVQYPEEYHDVNLYSPFFSIIIAPFALMPEWLGLLLWNIALALILFWAIKTFCKLSSYLPYGGRSGVEAFIIWFCAHELLLALFMQQYNVAIAAGLIMTYCCVEKEKDFWAAFWIMLGTFVKLYGIVGLALFFFSRHKGRFIISCLFWAAMMFVVPMLISSTEYIVNEYGEWYMYLAEKNDKNVVGSGEGIRESMQNISLLGIIRRVTLGTYSDLWIIIPGSFLFFMPYQRLKQWKSPYFRQMFLASTMMFMCLFSTGTESSGYITALIGCCIWYKQVPWKRNTIDLWLLILALILTSFSNSDLFPRYLRNEWCRPFALKALPIVIIWFKLSYEMLTRNYTQSYGTENIRRH